MESDLPTLAVRWTKTDTNVVDGRSAASMIVSR
jgi:hypothetical protein